MRSPKRSKRHAAVTCDRRRRNAGALAVARSRKNILHSARSARRHDESDPQGRRDETRILARSEAEAESDEEALSILDTLGGVRHDDVDVQRLQQAEGTADIAACHDPRAELA